jgi:hypothetical protein
MLLHNFNATCWGTSTTSLPQGKLEFQVLSPSRLKKQLKGRHFSSDAEVIAAAETLLDGQPSEFFLSVFQSLVALACFLPGRAKDLSAPGI